MKVTSTRAARQAVTTLPPELQGIATRWFERVDALDEAAAIADELYAPLARLVAISDFAGNTALKELPWLVTQPQPPQAPDPVELEEFASSIATSPESIDMVKQQLRRYRNRYLLKILWREVEGLASLDDSLLALSDLGDRLLEAAAGYAEQQMRVRFGVVRNDAGDKVSIVILAMGKLGGRELNFSSDVDLIFLHPADGEELYFVATGLGDGSHKFSKTKDEHDAAVAEYLKRLRQKRREGS